MTKIADPQPPYCASCFQKPEGRVVDFEAAYDGPVIPGSPEAIPIDDLVICESCLAEAFDLIDPQNLRETITELVQMLEDSEREIVAKDKAIRGSHFTITELIDHPIAKFPGKPKLEALSPEDREKVTKGLYARRGTSPAPKNSPRNRKVAA
jgi:hypothetical protein